jgi:hypothetical protein
MNQSFAPPSAIQNQESNAPARHRGLIFFCEKQQRYEKGLKAWIFLGPYLLGAFGLERVITEHAQSATAFVPWLGLLAYLVLFPLAWRRILKLTAGKKTASA